MNEPEQGTGLAAPVIFPNGPSHYSTSGAGGYHEVPSLLRRNLITMGDPARLHFDGMGSGRRRLGMLVCVTKGAPETWKTYRLEIPDYDQLSDEQKLEQLASNTNWVERKSEAPAQGGDPGSGEATPAAGLVKLTEAELLTKAAAGQLVPGMRYQFKHFQIQLAKSGLYLNTTNVPEGTDLAAYMASEPGEILIATAQTESRLAPEVQSLTYPQDVLTYQGEGVAILGEVVFKQLLNGNVTSRHDTVADVSANYDWRHTFWPVYKAQAGYTTFYGFDQDPWLNRLDSRQPNPRPLTVDLTQLEYRHTFCYPDGEQQPTADVKNCHITLADQDQNTAVVIYDAAPRNYVLRKHTGGAVFYNCTDGVTMEQSHSVLLINSGQNKFSGQTQGLRLFDSQQNAFLRNVVSFVASYTQSNVFLGQVENSLASNTFYTTFANMLSGSNSNNNAYALVGFGVQGATVAGESGILGGLRVQGGVDAKGRLRNSSDTSKIVLYTEDDAPVTFKYMYEAQKDIIVEAYYVQQHLVQVYSLDQVPDNGGDPGKTYLLDSATRTYRLDGNKGHYLRLRLIRSRGAAMNQPQSVYRIVEAYADIV